MVNIELLFIGNITLHIHTIFKQINGFYLQFEGLSTPAINIIFYIFLKTNKKKKIFPILIVV